MEQWYQIAGLCVAMDTFGKTEVHAERYRIERRGKADICISSDRKVIKEKHPDWPEDICEYIASGRSFYDQLLDFDGMMLHSSAVVVDGEAYLFSATSGTGKSTHTQLWLDMFGERAYIINDDKPAIRLEDGRWYVYGTPWSGKYDISVNTRVPLGGIAMIYRGEKNSIHPWNGKEAVVAVYRQIRHPLEYVHKVKSLELLNKLLTTIKVWKLTCNTEKEAALVAYEAMTGQYRKEGNKQ